MRMFSISAVVVAALFSPLGGCATNDPGSVASDPVTGAKALQSAEAGFTVLILATDDAMRQPGFSAKDAETWRDRLDKAYSALRIARGLYLVRQTQQPVNDPVLEASLAKAATENDAAYLDDRAKLDALATAAPK